MSLDPADHTVRELRDAVADVDDATELRRIKVAEIQGKDRKTAKGAIDDRLEDLDAGTSVMAGEDDDPESGQSKPDEDDESAAADVQESPTTPSGEHETKPDSAAGRETVVVRNPSKTTLQLPGVKGELAPGETREYAVTDQIRQYIRENTLQVVTTR